MSPLSIFDVVVLLNQVQVLSQDVFHLRSQLFLFHDLFEGTGLPLSSQQAIILRYNQIV